MVVKSMNSYIADELANKVNQLQVALRTAEHIIDALESENQRLQNVLMSFNSDSTKDLVMDSEALYA